MADREDIEAGLKAALDVARRARPRELVRMALPARMRKVHVLNEGDRGSDETRSAGEIAAAMRKLRNRLKGEAFVADGGVDYARLRGSEVVEELARAAGALRSLRPEDLGGEDDRKAFWINLYNVLMIHGVIALGVQDSVMEIPTFFTTVAYRVGPHLFSPDVIEHGLLRLNAPHPSGRRLLEPSDARLAWAPAALDPRIHAALVCVAKSCPPIAFYDAERLDPQLDMASGNLVASGAEVDHAARRLRLSSLFRSYGVDFGGRPGVTRFLREHATEPQRAELVRALDEGYEWRWLPYDWSLNTL